MQELTEDAERASGSARAGAATTGMRSLRRLAPGLAWGRADLHVHSWWSDGGQSPEAIVRAASGRVDVVAITDHDELRGALLARDFSREHPELGVEVIVGE